MQDASYDSEQTLAPLGRAGFDAIRGVREFIKRQVVDISPSWERGYLTALHEDVDDLLAHAAFGTPMPEREEATSMPETPAGEKPAIKALAEHIAAQLDPLARANAWFAWGYLNELREDVEEVA